jgi:hypothetical protein
LLQKFRTGDERDNVMGASHLQNTQAHSSLNKPDMTVNKRAKAQQPCAHTYKCYAQTYARKHCSPPHAKLYTRQTNTHSTHKQRTHTQTRAHTHTHTHTTPTGVVGCETKGGHCTTHQWHGSLHNPGQKNQCPVCNCMCVYVCVSCTIP